MELDEAATHASNIADEFRVVMLLCAAGIVGHLARDPVRSLGGGAFLDDGITLAIALLAAASLLVLLHRLISPPGASISIWHRFQRNHRAELVPRPERAAALAWLVLTVTALLASVTLRWVIGGGTVVLPDQEAEEAARTLISTAPFILGFIAASERNRAWMGAAQGYRMLAVKASMPERVRAS